MRVLATTLLSGAVVAGCAALLPAQDDPLPPQQLCCTQGASSVSMTILDQGDHDGEVHNVSARVTLSCAGTNPKPPPEEKGCNFQLSYAFYYTGGIACRAGLPGPGGEVIEADCPWTKAHTMVTIPLIAGLNPDPACLFTFETAIAARGTCSTAVVNSGSSTNFHD